VIFCALCASAEQALRGSDQFGVTFRLRFAPSHFAWVSRMRSRANNHLI
jgi:hypothetical protein